MLAEAVSVGGVVEGDDDGVVIDAQVAIQAGQESVGEMPGLPGVVGLAEAFPQGMKTGLCQESHGHASIANVEVEGAGAFPAQGLIGVEEFLDMPTLGVMDSQVFDLVAGGGGDKGLEPVVGAPFPGALDDLVEKRAAVLEMEGSGGGGETGPTGGKAVGVKGSEFATGGTPLGQGSHHIEGRFAENVFEEVDGDVLGVGEEQGRGAGGRENACGQVEQFGSGLGDGAGGGADGESQRLSGLDIQAEEGLSVLQRMFTLG